MEKYLTWNKGIFESSYQIFDAGRITSTLFLNTWRSEGKAITHQQTYLFKDNGFLETNTKILNEQNEVIGNIVYAIWKTKATVNLSSGENYAFSFVNIWQSKWTISNMLDKQINYDSATSSGEIMSNTADELMLITGFYVREHYKKLFMIIIFVVLFFPIISRNLF